MNKELEDLIRFLALRNAIEHDGKARVDSVISKLLAVRSDLKSDVKGIVSIVKNVVEQVNLLSIEEQNKEIEKLNVSILEIKKETKEYKLPPLPNVKDSVVTRFPPEPNGYPHIGHAKAAILDEEYARMYKGKFILRFDDTNPLKEKIEYYDAILDGLNWLEVKPDIIKNTSDDLPILYKYAEELIKKGYAYVCLCKQAKIKENRRLGISCECRNSDIELNLKRWEDMFNSYKPNEAILRYKGDLKSQNTVMRDPTLFRIIDAEHPKQGKKYRVWPTYDFAAPIEDSLDGVTHAMRSKEYELRNELYYEILDRLGLRKPLVIEFSRLEFEGIPVSKRMIKPLIEQGKVHGWDDPRLPTLIALRRKGILPKAIREFVLSLGFTKSDTKPPIERLEAINRRLLDGISIRLFFVSDPVELVIHNMPMIDKITVRNHPDKELGVRDIRIGKKIFISNTDAKKLIKGDEIRLLELFNVRIEDVTDGVVYARYTSKELKDIPKIQWVSNGVEVKVIVTDQLFKEGRFNEDSLKIINGYGEEYVKSLEIGARVQFVRFGFCILDKANTFILTHK